VVPPAAGPGMLRLGLVREPGEPASESGDGLEGGTRIPNFPTAETARARGGASFGAVPLGLARSSDSEAIGSPATLKIRTSAALLELTFCIAAAFGRRGRPRALRGAHAFHPRAFHARPQPAPLPAETPAERTARLQQITESTLVGNRAERQRRSIVGPHGVGTLAYLLKSKGPAISVMCCPAAWPQGAGR